MTDRFAIRKMAQRELAAYVEERVLTIGEDEAIAVLENRFCSSDLCLVISQSPRLTSFYSIRLRLVAHRHTPLHAAMKFVHYLYWRDLLRLSTNFGVAPQIRRAIDKQLAASLSERTLGERIATAKICSRDLLRQMLFDPDPKVFTALLANPRMTEDDLIYLIASTRATPEQLTMIASHAKWSVRRPVRMALVVNPDTPRATAASQLLHLTAREREEVLGNPALSTYLRRCIERL
ncbi:MAG: hypothetical protein ACYC7A_05990 [Thermoanaerobaculia bacterium]